MTKSAIISHCAVAWRTLTESTPDCSTAHFRIEGRRVVTMNHYFVLFPGAAYAGSFYGRTEREARAAARRWLGIDRLPRGTAVWEGAP